MEKKKRKFTKKEIIALSVLIILMIAVAAVGAVLIVNNVNTANREATNTLNTTIKLETSIATESTVDKAATEKVISGGKKSSNASSKETTVSETKSTTSKNSTASSKTASKKSSVKTSKTSNNSKTNSSSGGSKISIITPEKNTKHKSDEKCVINGTTCYVGDTIKITLNLTAPKILENYQGYTSFDTSYLTCTSCKSNSGGYVNAKDDKVLYNASVISGMDFRTTGTVYTAEFKVKKAGSTTLKNTWQVLTDINDKDVSPASCKDAIVIFS